MNAKKINMKDLIARHFQYGMTMDGSLPANDKYSVGYFVNPDCLTVMFHCKFGNYWEYVKQQISLDWALRRYGSKNVYFICPVCGKRAFVLHSSVAAFVCRECNKLANKICQNGYEEKYKQFYPVFM